MTETLTIEEINCDYILHIGSKEIAYLVYPGTDPLPKKWLSDLSNEYGVTICVVHVPADRWNDLLTPWAEPSEAKGFPPFGGKASEFLKKFQEKIIPEIEKVAKIYQLKSRNLIGVSLSGLFSLWQWMFCDTFTSIASLSGSFWYPGFLEWFENKTLPIKIGKAFFLLGEKEPKAKIKAYQSVGINTEKIVEKLKSKGYHVSFEWVSGDHFSNPLKRVELAFRNLYQIN